MEETFNLIKDISDSDLLRYLVIFCGGLFIMKVCDWLVIAVKTFHDWLASLFPTSIDRK